MNILHLPSWFPNRHFSTSGLFTKKQIEALATIPDTRHVVLVWQNTRYATLRNPLTFLGSLIRSLKKPRCFEKRGVQYVFLDVFQSVELIFGNNARRLENALVAEGCRLVREQKIDLLHAHVAYPGGLVAMRIGDLTGLPYVISEHMGPFPLYEYRNPREHLQRRIIEPVQRSRTVVAVSEIQAQQIRTWTNRDAIVIPNVVDPTEFTISSSQAPKKVFEFVAVSRLVEQKGVDILLTAASILLKRRQGNFGIVICGEGPQEQELRRLCLQLGIERHVEWVDGFDRQAVVGRIRSCHCLVSSSRWESFGVTLVEAMACGKPVIATRCGGPEDFVNEENGILVEKENPGALAEAMVRMMEHFGSYSPAAIRESCMRRFSPEAVARRYAAEVYGLK